MKKSGEIVKICCICNGGKPLTEYAKEINETNAPCSRGMIRHKFKCGNKCGRCLPYLKPLLTVENNI